MGALSWWDHYGPAACIASFTGGFVFAFAMWYGTFLQFKKAANQRVADAREDRDYWKQQWTALR